MGEKDAAKNEGEKKADVGPKKDDGPATVVLKLDMHCEGCARKIKRSVRHFEGVESVKADTGSNKLTVTGKVDPGKLRERVAEKTKKKVELVSPQPKKDAAGGGGGGDKKPEEKTEKKADDKKPKEVPKEKPDDKKADDKKPKEAAVSTVILKIRLHCDDCAQKIKGVISKTKGVESVAIDEKKNLVTVKGTMDVKALAPSLKAILKRSVVVVPPAKKADGGGEKKAKEGGGEKKEKEGGGDKKEKGKEGGGDKKEKESGGGGAKKEGEAKAAAGGGGDASKKEEPKVEVKKMEYHGYPPEYSSYYSVPPAYDHGYINEGYADLVPQFNQGYANQGYAMEYPPYPALYPAHAPQMFSEPPHPPPYPALYPAHAPQMFSEPPYPVPYPSHAPQMFSDENPNACSVM